LIAAKLEDKSTPKMEDLCYISDNSFSETEIKELEERVCRQLSFRLCPVTPKHFVNELLRASHACPCRACPYDHGILRQVVGYLLALSRYSYELTLVKPSLLAAASVYLARVTLGIREDDLTKRCHENNPYWTKTLQHYSGYSIDDLQSAVLIIHKYQSMADQSPNVKGIWSGFKTPARRCASLKTAPRVESLGFKDLDVFHDDMVECIAVEQL
jgi:cyclin A